MTAPWAVEDITLTIETRSKLLELDLKQRGWGVKYRVGTRSWANPITRNVVIARSEGVKLSGFLQTINYMRVLAHEAQHTRDFKSRLGGLFRGAWYLLSRKYRLWFELRAILAAHNLVKAAVWGPMGTFSEEAQYNALLPRLLRLEGWRGPYWLGYSLEHIEAEAKRVEL